MKMTLLPYAFTAEHVKGTSLKDADTLSRAPTEQPSHEDRIAEQGIINQVNSVVQAMPATDKKLNDTRHLNKYDQELQQLQEFMQKPSSIKYCPKLARPYFTSRHDISEFDGILCKGWRIIIPQIIRPNILKLIHAGHQGIEKCKRRARDCCYWPNMNQQIESVVKKCTVCARSAPAKSAETLKPHPVLTQPWQKIGTDLFQTNGRNYIVVMDTATPYGRKFTNFNELRPQILSQS